MKRSFFLLALTACAIWCISDASAATRRIMITRHGQPILQGQKQYDGDWPLSDLGRLQATKLGKYLKSINFNGKIYASPYWRTVETGAYIGTEMNIPVTPYAPIQERVHEGNGKDKGSGAALPNLKQGGMSLAQLNEKFPGKIDPKTDLPDKWLLTEPEDRKVAHTARVGAGLQQILKQQKEGDILLVCHAGSVGGLNRYLQSLGAAQKIKGMSWNCCLFIYELKDDGTVRFDRFVEPTEYLEPAEITSNKMTYAEMKKDAKKDSSSKSKKSKKSKKSL